jgi:hypothetical protein
MRAGFDENMFSKFKRMIAAVKLDNIITKRELVAIKLHFGESGNFSYIHPVWIREIVKIIKELGANPFLTDTSTLYAGQRAYAVAHIETALSHGFNYPCVEAPIIISDGLKGNESIDVKINQKHYSSVSIASSIYHADSMVVVSHFKGHILAGFGGALKNVGMGCADRAGKYKMHMGALPIIKKEVCKGCKQCVELCPGKAISIVEGQKYPQIDTTQCIGCGQCFVFCANGVFKIDWDAVPPEIIIERMIEFTYGALLNKKNKVCFINFLINITPDCDCLHHTDAYIVQDIGITVSVDPVAVDQASVDLVNQQSGLRNTALKSNFDPGEDKFAALFPKANWQKQLEYAEQLGLGMRTYELVDVSSKPNSDK